MVKKQRPSIAENSMPIDFEERVSRACLDNPDLPRSFVKDLLLALDEPRSTSTPFKPRTRKAGIR